MSTDPAQSRMTATASPCVMPHGKFCRRPARLAGEITPPWAPIVRLPTLDHGVIVMGRHVEMHEVYSSVCSFRGEGEDQGRIRITDSPTRRRGHRKPAEPGGSSVSMGSGGIIGRHRHRATVAMSSLCCNSE